MYRNVLPDTISGSVVAEKLCAVMMPCSFLVHQLYRMFAKGIPLKVRPVPSAAGTLMFTVGSTFGVPSSRCQFGEVLDTADQNAERCMASPSCVVPLVKAALLKIGDALSLLADPVTVTPSDITTLSGRISVGMVVVLEPAAWFVPTIL